MVRSLLLQRRHEYFGWVHSPLEDALGFLEGFKSSSKSRIEIYTRVNVRDTMDLLDDKFLYFGVGHLTKRASLGCHKNNCKEKHATISSKTLEAFLIVTTPYKIIRIGICEI